MLSIVNEYPRSFNKLKPTKNHLSTLTILFLFIYRFSIIIINELKTHHV